MSSLAPVRYEPHHRRHASMLLSRRQSQPRYACSTAHNIPCRPSSRRLTSSSSVTPPPQHAEELLTFFFASSPARDFYTFTCGAPLPQSRDASSTSSVYRPLSAPARAPARSRHTSSSVSCRHLTHLYSCIPCLECFMICVLPFFNALTTHPLHHSVELRTAGPRGRRLCVSTSLSTNLNRPTPFYALPARLCTIRLSIKPRSGCCFTIPRLAECHSSSSISKSWRAICNPLT